MCLSFMSQETTEVCYVDGGDDVRFGTVQTSSMNM